MTKQEKQIKALKRGLITIEKRLQEKVWDAEREMDSLNDELEIKQREIDRLEDEIAKAEEEYIELEELKQKDINEIYRELEEMQKFKVAYFEILQGFTGKLTRIEKQKRENEILRKTIDFFPVF